jgi:hypothetical protein
MDMKKTAAKFVSAIFATIIASSTLTAAPEAENEEKEKPADTCLLGPDASAPAGGHWYYRADRANKRNCWYLGEAKNKGARKAVAEEDSAAAEKPAAPAPKKPVAQRSITDAHAELPPQTSLEPDTKTVATQRITAAPADAQRAVATRWPEPAAVSPPAPSPAPAPAPRAAETLPPNQTQAQATPATPPPPRPFAPQPLPAKANAADKPLSLPMLLTVLAGGLSVIGVMASVIFARFKSQQGKPRPKRRLSRSAPMPPLQTPEKPLPEKSLPETPLPEDSRAPDDPTRRLHQMLADIQKRAAA